MMKTSLPIVLLLLLLLLTACSPDSQPKSLQQSGLELSYTISNKAPRVGDSLQIKGSLTNLTDQELNLQSGVMIIHLFNPGDKDEYVDGLVGMQYKLKPGEAYTDSATFTLRKPGVHKLLVAVRGVTSDPPSSDSKKLSNYNLYPIKINVTE